MNIAVTTAAETFMRRMVRFNDGNLHAGFRLTVSPGGCTGLATQFSIEAAPQPDDATLDVNGLKIFLPLETRALLAGATIDFRDGAMTSGLAIINPNVSDCGCGSSGAGRGGRHATVSVSSIQIKS
jgi:iron-sulfur cluster assembly protein